MIGLQTIPQVESRHDYKGIIRDCLNVDPSARPSAAEVSERLVQAKLLDIDILLSSSESSTHALARGALPWDGWNVITPRVNALNIDGETPLMVAKDAATRSRILRYLRVPASNRMPSDNPEFSHNIDIEFNLSQMVALGNISAIESLEPHIDDLVYVKSKLCDQKTTFPLHEAAEMGSVCALKALLRLKIFDMNDIDREGRSVLHIACSRGYTEFVRTLLQEPSISQTPEKNVLHSLSPSSSKPPDMDPASVTNRSSLHLQPKHIRSERDAQFNININLKDIHGEAALHVVSRKNFTCIAKLLLSNHTADVNIADQFNNFTPLHIALLEQSFDVAMILLSRDDIDVSRKDNNMSTPLHLLASKFDSSNTPDMRKFICKLHLSDNNDVFNSRSRTPLMIACELGNTDFVRAYMPIVDIEAQRMKRLLRMACQSGQAATLRVLLARSDTNVNSPIGQIRNETLLALAVFYRRVDVVKDLLARKDILPDTTNDYRETPLHIAVQDGFVEITELLLSHEKVDVNAQDKHGQTPLHIAVSEYRSGINSFILTVSEERKVDVVKVLLSKGNISPNLRDNENLTPLARAILAHNIKYVEELLLHPDVSEDSVDAHGSSALLFASLTSFSPLTNFFYARSPAYVNTSNQLKNTPLLSAAQIGSEDIVDLFLSHEDIEVNSQNNVLNTPLHAAAGARHAGVVRRLLSHSKINCNIVNEAGETALHFACKKKPMSGWEDKTHAPDVVRLLAEHPDVEIGVRDAEGKTPLDHAEESGFEESVRVLREKLESSEKS